jgi:hypothetical protein
MVAKGVNDLLAKRTRDRGRDRLAEETRYRDAESAGRENEIKMYSKKIDEVRIAK